MPTPLDSSPRVRPSAPAVAILTAGLCLLGALLIAMPLVLRRCAAPASDVPPAGAWAALAGVKDPELGVSVVDLGLVRRVEARGGGEVEVTVVVTSAACPFQDLIIRDIRRAVESVPGVRSVRVTIDWSTPWTPEMATPELGRRLGVEASAGP